MMPFSISPSVNLTLKIVADLTTSKSGTIILKESANTGTVNCARETADFA